MDQYVKSKKHCVHLDRGHNFDLFFINICQNVFVNEMLSV